RIAVIDDEAGDLGIGHQTLKIGRRIAADALSAMADDLGASILATEQPCKAGHHAVDDWRGIGKGLHQGVETTIIEAGGFEAHTGHGQALDEGLRIVGLKDRDRQRMGMSIDDLELGKINARGHVASDSDQRTSWRWASSPFGNARSSPMTMARLIESRNPRRLSG